VFGADNKDLNVESRKRIELLFLEWVEFLFLNLMRFEILDLRYCWWALAFIVTCGVGQGRVFRSRP
jgi:hypothetical protein